MNLEDIFHFDDSEASFKYIGVICALVLGLSIFLYTNVGTQTNLVLYLAFMAIIIVVAAFLKSQNPDIPVNFLGHGEAQFFMMMLAIGIAFGIFVGGLSTASGQTLVLPVQAISVGNVQFLFVNIIAPIIEPLAFRGILTPILIFAFAGLFGHMLGDRFGEGNARALGVIVGLFISVAIFGLYHVNTYYTQTNTFLGTFNYLEYATLFGLFFTLAAYLPNIQGIGAGSIAVEIGWHFVNNLIASGFAGFALYGTIIAFVLIFGAGAWFAENLFG